MSLTSLCTIIDSSVRLVADIRMDPWSIVGAEVEIDEGTVIGPYVMLKSPTETGKHSRIYQFSSIDEDTPGLKYKGGPTHLVVGDRNVIRESVTIRRGTVQDRTGTTIDDCNLITTYVHIDHDGVVGNHRILVNNMALAGHVHVDDQAISSDYTLVHQCCRIGAYNLSGMGSAIGKDVPTYVAVFGSPTGTHSINSEGIRWRGFSSEVIHAPRRAYKVIYRQGHTVKETPAELAEGAT